MGCLTASVKLLNEQISASVECLNEVLKVRCGIVCTLTEIVYIIYLTNSTMIHNSTELKND